MDRKKTDRLLVIFYEKTDSVKGILQFAQKLKFIGTRSAIETVRGMGYCLRSKKDEEI